MKTKAFSILIAVLTSASMISVASAQRANGKFGLPRADKSPSTRVVKSTPRVLPETCVSDACCTTKTQVRTVGGRATTMTTSKVMDCKTSCQIADNSQRAVCAKGLRL